MKVFFTIGSMLISLIVLDLSWTGRLAKGFYARHIGHFFAGHVSILPIMLFYILYTAGLYFFVVSPSLLAQSSTVRVFFSGAFFGLVAYGTYDLVNQGLFKDWPIIVTVIDMLWGMILTGLVSLAGVFASRILG